MVATDGHRLAHIEKTGENLPSQRRKEDPHSAQGLAELQSLLVQIPKTKTHRLCQRRNTLFFRVGKRVLTSRKLTGQFPNYEAVLPRDNNKSVIVRCEDLSAPSSASPSSPTSAPAPSRFAWSRTS